MPVIKENVNKNVWETICIEYEEKRTMKKKQDSIVEYDPFKHNPVFYGFSYEQASLDNYKLLDDFKASLAHPASFGFSVTKFHHGKDTKLEEKSVLDKTKCTEREFIEHLVFPTLMKAMECMLVKAEQSKCFERKRTAFNACDFIVEYLYKNNPFKSNAELEDRRKLDLFEIPFAKSWLVNHPRPSLPKSLIWTESEAASRIQAFYKGYLVRRDPEVQELRQWQRELREENQNIVTRVDNFWSAMPPVNSGRSSVSVRSISVVDANV